MADVTVDVQTSNPDELTDSGMKAYLMRDYNTAVTSLSRAAELMVAKLGEQHDSLGDVYLYYGKALLEVSREEAEPLGDAIPREINSDSDNEPGKVEESSANGEETKKEKVDEKNVEQPQEGKINGSGENKSDKVEQSDAKPEESEAKPTADTGEVKEKEATVPDEPCSSSTSAEVKAPEDGGESTEDKIEEDPTDLQVAWEILELAKLIFERRADIGKKDLADTLVVLGEVSLESENFESAIADIKQGLEIQKQILKPDSRNLAETYYKLAIALSTNNQIDEAVENFNISLNVLNNRINKLKLNEEHERDEIKDIEALIPEIEEKIADMKSYKEEAANKLVSAMSVVMKQPTSEMPFEPSSSQKQASNISHLVKRKRKPDDVPEESEESPAKKQPPTV